MNPIYSSRISDCRGLDDNPQSIDTSKRCLDDRTLRSDTSYLINTNQNHHSIHNNNRQQQDISQNGTFFLQNNQNGILEDRNNISYINCSFNQPNKKNSHDQDDDDIEIVDDDEIEQPETPPQNDRNRDYIINDNSLVVEENKDAQNDLNHQRYQSCELNIRQDLPPVINFQESQIDHHQSQLNQNVQQQPIYPVDNRTFIRNQRDEQLLRQQQLQQQRIRMLIQQVSSQGLDQTRSRQLNNNNNNNNNFNIHNSHINSNNNNINSSILQRQQQQQQFQSRSSQIQQLCQNNQMNQQQLIRMMNQNAINRVSQQNLERRRQNNRNQSPSNHNNRHSQLDHFSQFMQNINFMASYQQPNNNHNPRNPFNQQRQMFNQMRSGGGGFGISQRDQIDDNSDQNSMQDNEIENIEAIEQQRQIDQLNNIIRNSRRRMNENRRNNSENQIQVGGRYPQIVSVDEEDKLRAKLIFKKAFTHLIALTVFSIFLLAIFYIHLLLQGFWLILFFISCFFTGNKLQLYKNLTQDATYEEKRQLFFDIVEYIFLNVLVFLIFLFLRLLDQSITLLLVYTPFVHIIWWLVFTTKTQESMNRHVELLLRIYAVTQAILFSVQYDRIVNWSWVSIFLPSWILLSSLGFYIFGLTVLFCCSIYYCIIGQTDKYQIKGLIWCLLVSSFIVGCSLYFLLGLMDYFQSDSLQMLRYSSGAFITGSALSTIYSVACSHDLEVFIALANSENLFNGAHQVQMLQNQGSNNNRSNNQQQAQQNEIEDEQQQMNILDQIANFSEAQRGQQEIQPKKIKIIKTTKNIPKSIPQFLIKFSSTYFQQSDVNKELAALLLKKNQEALNKLNKDLENQNGKRNSTKKIESDKTTSDKKIQNNKTKRPSSKNNNLDPEECKITSDCKVELQGKRESVKEEARASMKSMQDSKLSSQPSTQQCLVCFDNSPNCVILECGHGGLCSECAFDIWKKTGECYLCRQTISKIVEIDTTQKFGKYKQIVAISNMHEVSHDKVDALQQSSEIHQLHILPQSNNLLNQPDNSNNNNNNQQIAEQPFEEVLNHQLEVVASGGGGVSLSGGAIAVEQNQINQQNNSNEQNIIQINQQSESQNQVNIPLMQLEQSQQNQNENDIKQQQGQRQSLKDQEVIIIINESQDKQKQQQDEQKQQQDQHKQQQDEEIGIIKLDDDEENSERNQFQESSITKVSMSQYQPQFISIGISELESQDQHQSIINQNNNNYVLQKKQNTQDQQHINSYSQQTLSFEQIQNQLQQIDDDNFCLSQKSAISHFRDQINIIKKPDETNSINIQSKENNSSINKSNQYSVVINKPKTNEINMKDDNELILLDDDETILKNNEKNEINKKDDIESFISSSPSQEDLTKQHVISRETNEDTDNNPFKIKKNLAQSIPVSADKVKINSTQNNSKPIYYNSEQNTKIQNYNINLERKGGSCDRIQGQEISDCIIQGIVKNNSAQQVGIDQNVSEWNIEETVQSSHRSDGNNNNNNNINKSSIRNTNPCNPDQNGHLSNHSFTQDTSKIQTLDKVMLKYFDSNEQNGYYDEIDSQSQQPFTVSSYNYNQTNSLNSGDDKILNQYLQQQQQQEILKSNDEKQKQNYISSQDKENQDYIFDDVGPAIQRIGMLQQKDKDVLSINASNQLVSPIAQEQQKQEQQEQQKQQIQEQDQLLQQLQQDQQSIAPLLSTIRIDQETNLINFDESQEQSDEQSNIEI